MESTLCFDLSTNLWHERAFLNEECAFVQDKVIDIMFLGGRHIGIDKEDGHIYLQSLDIYTDGENNITRERTFTHLFDENKRIRYSNLTVGFETGVGNQVDPGYDPQAVLYLSNDGARTWSGGYSKSIGKAGEYLKRVIWQRLGQARQKTFKVRVTSSNKIAITGAYFNVE